MKFVKPCPRIPGTYPADTGKLCKALSPGGAWDSPGELQSPVPGFPAHILRTPANSAKPCPRVGRGIPPGNCKACPPVTVKQGGMTTAIPCKKKTAVKPPSQILFVFLITYGDSKPEGNSLSCKGTCKGW